MPRILKMVILRCGRCPFMEFKEDHGESNSDGCAYCKKSKRDICFDDHDPAIPAWCELPLCKTRKIT